MTTATTMKKKTPQEVKVIAVNTLNKYCKIYIQEVIDKLTPLVGKNIFKVNGSLKEKYSFEKSSHKGQMKDGTWYNCHYWIDVRHNHVDIGVKICVNGGSYDVKPTTAFTQYEEQSFCLFDIDNSGNLQEVEGGRLKFEGLDTVYNVEDLNKIAKEIEEASKQYDAILNRMPYRFRDVYYLKGLRH